MAESKHLIRIGKNISRLRKEKGLTIKQLGLECEIEKSNLVPIEKGRINVTILTLVKIAGALDVDLIELFRNTEK